MGKGTMMAKTNIQLNLNLLFANRFLWLVDLVHKKKVQEIYLQGGKDTMKSETIATIIILEMLKNDKLCARVDRRFARHNIDTTVKTYQKVVARIQKYG